MRPPVIDVPGPSPRAVLAKGISALHLSVDGQVQDRLLAYLDMLIKWNRAFNLTAIRDRDAMLSHHLLDCLAVVPALEWHVRARDGLAAWAPPRVLDVGSGAGLPGAVLALLKPDWPVTCVDTVAKKAGFVRQVAAELSITNLISKHDRVEHLPRSGFDIVVSRAFASLADFTRCTALQLAPGGCWLAMKGRPPTEEMSALPATVRVFHVEQLQVPGLDAQRSLVWMMPVSSS